MTLELTGEQKERGNTGKRGKKRERENNGNALFYSPLHSRFATTPQTTAIGPDGSPQMRGNNQIESIEAIP